jgi:hypothetical protein
MLHVHVGYFRLLVFGFGTSCLILMFVVSFLDLNVFVYGIVTCWDKKKHVLE